MHFQCLQNLFSLCRHLYDYLTKLLRLSEPIPLWLTERELKFLQPTQKRGYVSPSPVGGDVERPMKAQHSWQ